jgi:hypothetical protein
VESLSRLIRRGRCSARLKRRLASKGDWRIWYFAFQKHSDTLLPWWLHWLVKPGDYSHVIPFCQLNEQTVLTVDWLHGHVDFHARSCPEPGLPFVAEWVAWDMHSQGYDVVRIERWIPKVTAHNTGGVIANIYPSCVGFARHVLGVSRFILTPKGFYQWLVTNNGHVYDQTDYDRIWSIAVGSFGGGNKAAKQANEQAEKQLREQRRVNNVQIANLNAETDKLKKQRMEAEAEAARIADENERKKKTISARNAGRTSLITTSELGVGDTLG